MFGYVLANGNKLTKEEKATYKAHYCGLCKVLKEKYGAQAILALSYDMVFLELLLADLTDSEEENGRERCIAHPLKEHEYIITGTTGYAADMQILLSYYSLLDHIRDDGKGKESEKKLRAFIPSLEEKYPRQSKALKDNLSLLTENEKANTRDAGMVSLIFGTILGEIFVLDDSSFFRDDLRGLGCGLGRFIYLLDAWCDREKDRKKGAYNPLPDDISRDEMREMLLDAASAASDAAERLPLDQHVSILRNILYSGIWSRFEDRKKEK